MARKTPTDMEDAIATVWKTAKAESTELMASEVRQKVSNMRVANKQGTEGLPKLRRTQEIIAKAREQWEAMPEDAKRRCREANRPWSLAASVKQRFPTEATEDLLRVWKLRLAQDESFTVREAKWVTYLRFIANDVFDLSQLASAYATREEAAHFLRKGEFTTVDIDAPLTMTIWELCTARMVGKVQTPEHSTSRSHRLGEVNASKAAEIAEAVAMADILLKGINEGRSEEDTNEPDDFPSHLHVGGLSDEALWVYALWLWHLMKGPEWRRLPSETLSSIVSRLFDWVRDHPWNSEMADHEELLRQLRPPVHRSQEDLDAQPLLRPTELLMEVGYKA